MKQTDKTYEQLTSQLRERLEELENGQTTIDRAVACYEEGLMLITELEERLQSATNKVEQLTADGDAV